MAHAIPITPLLAVAALLLAGACGSDVTTSPDGAGGVGVGGAGAQGGGGSGSGGAGGGVLCNPNLVSCDGPTPICQPGEVPSVIDACWGACVPILDCATEDSCDNCPTGFCASYEAWATEYRCVLPSLHCSALACGCLEPYFCIDPYDACLDAPSTTGADVRCTCPTC